MTRSHQYAVDLTWTGNTGSGYRGYERAHEVGAPGKQAIAGSADPAFRGDPARWNPEELLVVSLSQCHMLWYLGLCSRATPSPTPTRPPEPWTRTGTAAAGSPPSCCARG